MGEIFELIIGFIILIGIGFLAWFLFKKIFAYFKTVNSNVAPSIITACATILVGLGAVLISENRIHQRELEESHRESKIELYTRFNSFLFRLLAGTNEQATGEMPTDQEMIDFMVEFKRDMMFRSSPEVIRAMLNYEISSVNGGDDIIFYMNKLLLAMREDIGLPNSNLDNLEMIQLTLKDKSEVEKFKK